MAAASCGKAWFAWPSDQEIEELRAAFINQTDPAKPEVLDCAIFDRVIERGIYVPVGQARGFGAYRQDHLDDSPPAPAALVRNISRK